MDFFSFLNCVNKGIFEKMMESVVGVVVVVGDKLGYYREEDFILRDFNVFGIM